MTIEYNNIPLDSFKINGGSYLDNIVTGFKTIKAVGRETLEKSITTYETNADTTKLKSTKFSSRTIDVDFVIVRDTMANMHESMATLSSILNVENAEIIFNGEKECYYIGTPVLSTSINEYHNGISGTITINCLDPFKYAVNEEPAVQTSVAYDISGLEEYDEDQTYSVGDMVKHKDGNDWKAYECNTEGTTGVWDIDKWEVVYGAAFVVNYDGGYKAFPRFEVDFATDESGGTVGHDADCGFVQFAKMKDENTYRLQFGDDEEEQLIPVQVFNTNFTKSTLGSFSNSTSGTYHGWKDDANASASASGIKPKYGSQTGYHGNYLTANAAAIEDFTFKWKQCTYVSAKAQRFGFLAVCLDASGNIVAGVRYYKSGTGNTEGYVQTILDGAYGNKKTVDFKRSGKFGYTKSSGGSVRGSENYIKRAGDKITIKLACHTTAITLYPTNVTAIAKVGFFLCGYGTAKRPAMNYIRSAYFMGDSEENTFGSGDILDVDCNSTQVQLNKMDDPSLGDVGNDWSNFALDVGQNTIFVAYSDWCQLPPTFKMYYRKRWL